MKLAKGMYSDEEMMNDGEGEKPAETKSEPQVKAVSVEVKKEAGSDTDGMSKVFPAVGESVDSYDKKFGDLRITSLQLPEVADWENGKTYTLQIQVLQKENRIDQDTKYDEDSGQRIATSDPYTRADFEIVDIKPVGQKQETT